ncbi:MAG TPA: glycosyltransferase family 2 protein [Acidisarcina sp.]
MHSTKPLLTIAIPTYNRSSSINELLSHLAPQLKGVSSVELIISDNASTDSTPSVVEHFQCSGVALTYLRNETNLGMDGNFLQCFERARGKYVWLIGDDDVLVPGGLQKILKSLTHGDFDLVYVASYSFEGAYVPAAANKQPPAAIMSTALQYVQRVNVALTFLSGNIVNKDRVISVAHPPFSTLDGSKLIQLGWTYTLLRNFTEGLIINEPLIAARAGNTGGYAVFTVFGVSLRRITEDWLIEPALVRVMLSGTIHFFLPWFLLLMKSRPNTFEDEDVYIVLKGAYGDQFQYWLFNYAIIKLPRLLAKAWFLLGKVLLKVDGWIGSPIFG